MNMTHYMELLAVNQPWNLMIFMAIPIVLAETLAITELYLLFTRRVEGSIFNLNRLSGMVVGVYFIGIIVYPATSLTREKRTALSRSSEGFSTTT